MWKNLVLRFWAKSCLKLAQNEVFQVLLKVNVCGTFSDFLLEVTAA